MFLSWMPFNIINKKEMIYNFWAKSGNSYDCAWALQARYLLIAAFQATAEVVKQVIIFCSEILARELCTFG